MHTLSQDDVTEESYLILMKSTLFQICKKAMLSELIEDPPNGFDVALAWIFGINQNVVQVHDDEYVELFD